MLFRGRVKTRRTQWGLGLLSVLAALTLHLLGGLAWLERLTLDWRAQWFGASSPGPSDQLVVIAIDQGALDTIGRWPWPRGQLAMIIRELKRAGAKTVALDLLLDDPQEVLLTRAPGAAGNAGELQEIDGDALLAEAIRDHGGVVLATGFQFTAESEEEGGTATSSDSTSSANAVNAESTRRGSWRVPLTKVYSELAQKPALMDVGINEAVEQLRGKLLSKELASIPKGPHVARLAAEIGSARVLMRHARTSSVPSPAGMETLAVSQEPSTPVEVLGAGAARIGNVTFDTYDPDGQTRRIPLWVMHHGRLWPNLGLAAAMLHRGVDVSTVRVTPGRTEIELGEQKRVMPTAPARVSSGVVDGLHYVTWPRSLVDKPAELRGWQWPFYDEKNGRPAEVAIGRVYQPTDLNKRINENLAQVDRVFRLAVLSGATGGAEAKDNAGSLLSKAEARELTGVLEQLSRLTSDDELWADYSGAVKQAWADVQPRVKGELETLQGKGEGGSERAALLKEALSAMPKLLGEVDQGLRQIAMVRAELKRLLDGKLCFVGWVATGAKADFVSTSIDPRTPGVHLHVAVANAVLTGFQKVQGPAWLDTTLVLVIGLAGTFIGVRASVVAAPIITAMVIAAWFAIAGLIIWDRWGVIVSVSGPSASAFFGLVGVFVHRLLVEQAARRRTEERFKSRVAPQLVDILVNNPEMDTMKPQRRELSVMFTDLQGFTTTAERLGEVKTAEVLARFLGTMTDVVLAHGATFDKYIGDAIVTFWGAPIENEYHAADACKAVLEMIRTLEQMNGRGEFDEVGAGGLVMRVGLMAGDVMVGDFGAPPKNSSYTTLGDTTNLAARLEGANKVFGSRILVGQRLRDTAEVHAKKLVEAGQGKRAPVLKWRRLGRVRVKGKLEPITVFELVGDLQPKGERTQAWIDLTEKLVGAYERGDFDACDAAIMEYQQSFGDSPLLDLYRSHMIEWASRVDRAEAFDGCVELKEK